MKYTEAEYNYAAPQFDEWTLFDDPLMRLVFDGNIPATRLVLRIVLDRDDLEIISVKGQYQLESPSPQGHYVRLDVAAHDSEGKMYDIEVQRRRDGAGLRRARYHSSMMDVRLLPSGNDYETLKDSYVVFITEEDIKKKGCPIYHIERMIRETNEPAKDGSHILYVNGAYKADDPMGHLMHDFKTQDPSEFYYSELGDSVRKIKNTEGGKDSMSESYDRSMRECHAHGISQGISKGTTDERLRNISAIMKSCQCTALKAMELLAIPPAEQEELLVKM